MGVADTRRSVLRGHHSQTKDLALKAGHLGCLRDVNVQGGSGRSPEEHAGTLPRAKGIGLWTEGRFSGVSEACLEKKGNH